MAIKSVFKTFQDKNKLVKWAYNFYNNDLTKIDSYKPSNWVNAMMNLNEFSKKENQVNFYNKIKTKVKEKAMSLISKGFNSLINLKALFNKFSKNINLHKLIRKSTIKKSNRFKRKSKKFINKSPARIRTNYVAIKKRLKIPIGMCLIRLKMFIVMCLKKFIILEETYIEELNFKGEKYEI